MQPPPSMPPDRDSIEWRDGARPARIGLVLGGGGAAGLAFHAGVLWALHHDLGWDPRTADLIVGTSAGSIVGALLRSGVLPEDLAAWATGADPSSEGQRFRAMMTAADSTITSRAVPRMSIPRWHALAALRHPSQITGAIAGMLPHGLLDHSPRLAALDQFTEGWPSEPLWISAIRVGDGRVQWFGRDPEVDGVATLATAVAASCAVPFLARPVRIGNHRYLDGGVKSATHADVVHGVELDLVVVLSPMGHQGGRSPMRSLAHRRARREVVMLERSGLAVQLLSPDDDTARAMGVNMMDRNRTASVMRHAFLGAVAQFDAAATATLIRARGVGDPMRSHGPSTPASDDAA